MGEISLLGVEIEIVFGNVIGDVIEPKSLVDKLCPLFIVPVGYKRIVVNGIFIRGVEAVNGGFSVALDNSVFGLKNFVVGYYANDIIG